MASDLPSEQPAAASGIPFARHAACSRGSRSGSDGPGLGPPVLRRRLLPHGGVPLLRHPAALGADPREDGVLDAGAAAAGRLARPLRRRNSSSRHALPWLFGLYLLLQTALVFALLSLSDSTDFFAVLFAVLSMQLVQRWPLKQACVCIALFAPLTALGIYRRVRPRRDARVRTDVRRRRLRSPPSTRGPPGRRRRSAHRTESLARQLTRGEPRPAGLLGARRAPHPRQERSWIARELHDSVTQTIFAMTLAARSLLMLLPGGDRERVDGQLDRLTALANSALSEMRVLVSELRPEDSDGGRPRGGAAQARSPVGRLPTASRSRWTSRARSGSRRPRSRASSASRRRPSTTSPSTPGPRRRRVRLRLREPFSMEIRDQGRGFDADGATERDGHRPEQHAGARRGDRLDARDHHRTGRGHRRAGAERTRMRRGGLRDERRREDQRADRGRSPGGAPGAAHLPRAARRHRGGGRGRGRSHRRGAGRRPASRRGPDGPRHARARRRGRHAQDHWSWAPAPR